MSAHSSLGYVFDSESTVMVGEENRQDIEQETHATMPHASKSRGEGPQSKETSCPSLTTTLTAISIIASLAAAVTAATPTISATNDRRPLRLEIATEPSFSSLRSILSPSTIWKCVKAMAAAPHLTESSKTVTPKDAEATVADTIQQQPRTGVPCTISSTADAVKNYSNPTTGAPGHPLEVYAAFQVDDGTLSDDSGDERNDYETIASVNGQKIFLQVDTGCPSRGFIRRTALNKLGEVKEEPIPPPQIKAYTLLGISTAPKKTVTLTLDLYPLGPLYRHATIKLKILEITEDTCDFDVLLGRTTIEKLGGPEFISKVVQANTDRPTSGSSSFAATVLKSKNSKSTYSHMEKNNSTGINSFDTEKDPKYKEKDDAYKEKRLREYKELPLYQDGGMSSGSSTSALSHWQSGHATGSSGRDSGQPGARQSGQRGVARYPDSPGWSIPRAETFSTQSTQCTQFSLSRQDTTSSRSSWASSVPACGPREGERASETLAAKTAIGFVWTEEEEEEEEEKCE